MENPTEFLKKFIISITENFNLLMTENNFLLPEKEELDFLASNKSMLHDSFSRYYSEIGSYSLSWQNVLDLPADVQGEVKIINIIKALSDWKDVVYFEDDSELKNFKILDQFANEACCGFYTLNEKRASPELVYYYNFSDTPVSLQISPQQYLEMMVEAKGFFYWQRVLIDHENGNESPHVMLMKENLHKVFPDFSYDKFIKKYESLKNKKS